MKRIPALIITALALVACGTTGTSTPPAQAQSSQPKPDGSREHPCEVYQGPDCNVKQYQLSYYVKTPDGKPVLCVLTGSGVSCNWKAFNKLK